MEFEERIFAHGFLNSDGWSRVGKLKIGANEILVPAKEAEPLAEAIDLLMQNPQMRREMGRRSRELAEQEFGIERIVKKTFEVYAELLASRL